MCSSDLKAALNASFGTSENGEGNRQENNLWGTNGMVSRTLAYWKDGIVSMFDYIGRLRSVIKKKDEDIQKLQTALSASETKRKAVEAAMEKKEREFNERASIRALAARMRAAADAAARGDTPIARLVRQKARRNRVGLTRSRDKGEPRRCRKAVATDSGLLSRAGVLKRRSADMRQIEDFLVDRGPTHLPGETIPELKTDRTGYYDYLSRMSERIRAASALYTCSNTEAGGAAGAPLVRRPLN